jgi:hypothetical protein
LGAKAQQLIELTSKENAIAIVESVSGVSSLKDVDPAKYPMVLEALNKAIAEADPAQHLANEMGGEILNLTKITPAELLVLTTTAGEKGRDLNNLTMSHFGVMPNQLTTANYEEALAILRS